ncbi:MAG: hypothetical protein LBJ00_08295 [Planctomycetaceae bacterium]|jgi:hypothetical protein|nr:hypothetical protein [Planctomycetaceae bacterium]
MTGGFTFDYTHGYDTSGNNPTTAWTTYNPPCYHPINYRETIRVAIDGVLTFYYAWDSPTGQLADLDSCFIGEKVDYPGAGPTYTYPNPPFDRSVPNPTIKGGSASGGAARDDQRRPPFVTPYVAALFTATQNYRYQCKKCMAPSEWVVLMGPLSIVRLVNQITPPTTWQYEITKSGLSSTYTLPTVATPTKEEYNGLAVIKYIFECQAVLKQIQGNATREYLQEHFERAEGFFVRTFTRYVFKKCPVVTVDVAFDVKADQDETLANFDSDIITDISEPFVVNNLSRN